MPGVGAYTASKFGLEGLSHSLRRELMRYGVDVVIIGPGPIKTEIFDKIDKKFLESLKKTDYAKAAKGIPKRMKNAKKIAFPAEEVGKLIFNALHNPNRKTRYAITPSRMMYWTLPMLLPDRVLDQLIKRRSGGL